MFKRAKPNCFWAFFTVFIFTKEGAFSGILKSLSYSPLSQPLSLTSN